jgi:hypothetical protein
MKSFLMTLVVVAWSVVALAQQSVSTLLFTASADHDDPSLLTSYTVQAVDESNGALVSVTDLGKPTPDPVRDIALAFSALPNPYQPNGIYHLQVAALGPGGTSAQVPSPSFVYCPAPPPPPPPPPPASACADGIDNDGDGTIDFPADPGCTSASDTDETDPVVQPITLGETTILPNADSGNGNLLVAQSAVLSQAKTIQSLSFYVTTTGGKLRLGIYDATGPGGGPGQLKAQTAELTPVSGWNTGAVTSPVSLLAGTYWLAYFPQSNSLGFRNTSNASSSGRYYARTYGALPQTFSSSHSSTPSHWSFYATVQ